MRNINKIVIHCADTFSDMDVDSQWIRDIHVKQNGWKDIGYHYIILRDGTLEKGRPESQSGAHVAGHNASTIGVCLIGGKARKGENPTNFTKEQWRVLEALVTDLTNRYEEAEVVGHCDLDSGKTCPTFNVKAWWEDK